MRKWRRSARNTLALLLVTLAVCTAGLAMIDNTSSGILEKTTSAGWNALNLVTTLGDFRGLDERQQAFMMVTMAAFLGIGGFALSRLTGILSSNAVLAYRENKIATTSQVLFSSVSAPSRACAAGRLLGGRLRRQVGG